MRRSPVWSVSIFTLALALSCPVPLTAQDAYCNINSVKYSALTNGVQISVKSDGILVWDWENSWDARRGSEVSTVSIRFNAARLQLEKTLYDVDQEPVSNLSLFVPQNAPGGRGVVLTVNMSQPSKVKADLSEDRQTFLLTVYGTRTVERAGGAKDAEDENKAGTAKVTADPKGLVTVHAVKADIHQVVMEVARCGNVSVAVDDAVQRKVSLNLQNLPPLAIIKGIAAGYGLALSNVGDVYMLSEGVPTDLPTYLRSGTASFPTKYLKAADAKTLLPTFLFKYVHDNPEQNAVVVTAPRQMLDKIQRDLQAVDVPPPMIMVECLVVELTDGSDVDTQFRWLYQSREHSFGTDSMTGGVIGREVSMASGLASAIVPAPILRAWLRGLVTKGRAEVNAHPSMAAVNGKRAQLFIGSQRFIKVNFLQYGQTQERIETVPVGVKLSVQPWTGGNKEITTNLHVEVSNIVAIDPQTGVPRLSTREADSTLRTKDGDTIVIGGLSQRQEDNTYRRIPILGSLPLIGPLFRSKSKSAESTELVILIRPRLLDEKGQLPQEEDETIRQKFLRPGDLGCPVDKTVKSEK